MIRLAHITKTFGRFVALDDVSLDVRTGEAVALWGPNGAGKSTLVRCLLGLLPFRGTATVDGLDVRRRGKAVRRLIGYIPQEPALFDDLRVAEVAVLFARLKRAGSGDARRMIEEIGLGPHARKRIRQLSGGMKQRLSLGLALMTDPPVLLLDEPTSNLDAAGRQELLADVDRLRRGGKTVMLISHRPDEVRQIADRVVTLESGRIVGIDTPDAGDDGRGESSVLVDRRCVDEAVETLRNAGIVARPATGDGPDRASRVDRVDGSIPECNGRLPRGATT
ncbi:MAG: ABC transporter ATP-binding protein [Phycisphaerales bacterium]|nr:ABC transporter ATP-binding protein [Phycisphaerales bacterium]